MTANIMPFERIVKKRGAPSKRVCRKMADILIDVAAQIENGEIQDVGVAYVYSDGGIDTYFAVPVNPRGFLRAVKELKRRALDVLAENGPRQGDQG